MNADGLDANILQAFGSFHNEFTFIVPAQPGFDRHGFIRSVYHGLGQFHHSGNILEDPGTGHFTDHLFHRTAIIDINDIRIGLRNDLRSADHGIHGPTKDLNAHRALIIVNVQFLSTFLSIADQPL